MDTEEILAVERSMWSIPLAFGNKLLVRYGRVIDIDTCVDGIMASETVRRHLGSTVEYVAEVIPAPVRVGIVVGHHITKNMRKMTPEEQQEAMGT